MKLVFGIARPASEEYFYLRTREVDRPYPGVPREGELVDIDDAGEHGLSVEAVTWQADGTVLLEFGEADHLTDEQLDELGFDTVTEIELDSADEDSELDPVG